MSDTVNDLIQRAFETAGTVQVGETVGPRESQFALGLLNEMLARWESDFIPHGLSEVTTATVVYDGNLRSAIRTNLAVEIAKGPYPSEVTPLHIADAKASYLKLIGHNGSLEPDRALSKRESFSIETGWS